MSSTKPIEPALFFWSRQVRFAGSVSSPQSRKKARGAALCRLLVSPQECAVRYTKTLFIGVLTSLAAGSFSLSSTFLGPDRLLNSKIRISFYEAYFAAIVLYANYTII